MHLSVSRIYRPLQGSGTFPQPLRTVEVVAEPESAAQASGGAENMFPAIVPSNKRKPSPQASSSALTSMPSSPAEW